MSKRRSAELAFMMVLEDVQGTSEEGLGALDVLDASRELPVAPSFFHELGNHALRMLGKPQRTYQPSYRAQLYPTLARLEEQGLVESKLSSDLPGGRTRAYRLAEPMHTLRQVIGEELGLEANYVRPEDKAEDLDADSLEIVQVIMELEDRFGIKIGDDELEGLTTVRDLNEIIRSKLNQVGSS